MENMTWLTEQGAIAMAEGIAIIALVAYIKVKDKVIKSKDVLLLELAKECVAAIKVMETKADTNTEEHKSIDNHVEKVHTIAVKILAKNK